MRVFSAKTMSLLESKAYLQGHTAKEFMDRAGLNFAMAAREFARQHGINEIILLCGKGNNGGDAFVAGCCLLEEGFPVAAVQLASPKECSPLCRLNHTRFCSLGGKVSSNFSPKKKALLIDGLFGTGFSGIVQEPYASLIQQANQSGCPILSVDIPSGLNGSTGEADATVIHATETFFLEYPKTGFFLREGWNVVGKLMKINFGLPANIGNETEEDLVLATREMVQALFPVIQRNRHKYETGEVIGLAGSPSMPGAALLSSLAAFRAGAGLVRLLHSQGMQAELCFSPYELIKIPYQIEDSPEVLKWLQKGKASFIGPGLGRNKEVGKLLQECVPNLKKPCVIDADALYHYANSPFGLPDGTIFTPHTGEMQALLHQDSSLVIDEYTLSKCQHYVEERGITLILKGAPTFIFHSGRPIVNPTGNPGMATAGSGDVLTGILASLLAQGMNSRDAAIAGVYLHGLAGDIAADARGTIRGLLATDIITHLGNAYAKVEIA
ncbi:MAG: NAD(P)H-hydrate dehydratase [Candidatus Protochlamydia sp.]|nr:NAD(P)H-hydrate dehydratase [Candidatus Protochlamydia sp.]